MEFKQQSRIELLLKLFFFCCAVCHRHRHQLQFESPLQMQRNAYIYMYICYSELYAIWNWIRSTEIICCVCKRKGERESNRLAGVGSERDAKAPSRNRFEEHEAIFSQPMRFKLADQFSTIHTGWCCVVLFFSRAFSAFFASFFFVIAIFIIWMT